MLIVVAILLVIKDHKALTVLAVMRENLLGSFQLGQQRAVQQLGMKAFNFYYGKSVKIK